MPDPKKKKQVKTRDLSKPLTPSTWDKYVMQFILNHCERDEDYWEKC